MQNTKINKIYTLQDIKELVEPVAQRYGVEAINLFGSYAKGTASAQSDIDFRIDKGDVRGIKYSTLLLDLEDVLGKSIDLVTSASLDEDFKKRIEDEEVQIYAR